MLEFLTSYASSWCTSSTSVPLFTESVARAPWVFLFTSSEDSSRYGHIFLSNCPRAFCDKFGLCINCQWLYQPRRLIRHMSQDGGVYTILPSTIRLDDPIYKIMSSLASSKQKSRQILIESLRVVNPSIEVKDSHPKELSSTKPSQVPSPDPVAFGVSSSREHVFGPTGLLIWGGCDVTISSPAIPRTSYAIGVSRVSRT
ncbi:hypothetical protein F5146DRAFT_649042 [Armillaria mellea]|nr:hypothetical protein F5146DRAFT_649042 [Armillaria mellea]